MPCSLPAPFLNPPLHLQVRLHLLAHLSVIQTECPSEQGKGRQATLLALKLEEGVMSQGTQVASAT